MLLFYFSTIFTKLMKKHTNTLHMVFDNIREMFTQMLSKCSKENSQESGTKNSEHIEVNEKIKTNIKKNVLNIIIITHAKLSCYIYSTLLLLKAKISHTFSI